MLRCSALETAALEGLRRLGIRLALDDFGTGYSSLRYLQEHAVDAIKIDRTFVGGADGALASTSIVRTLIELGLSHGVEVVAEGIETADQLAALRELGCRFGQGYHFAQPIGPEWVDIALTEERRLAEAPATA
jgi:EAL domain-containing protein (putative c-di-GMP-specific phosphodiesterase class I)